MVRVAPGSLLVHMGHWCKQQLVNARLQHTERFTTLLLRFLVAERVDGHYCECIDDGVLAFVNVERSAAAHLLLRGLGARVPEQVLDRADVALV